MPDRPAKPIAPRRCEPFVLSCFSCDAGDGIECSEQAVLLGWVDLLPDPKGFSWTWLGTCPECQTEEAEEEARIQQECGLDGA